MDIDVSKWYQIVPGIRARVQWQHDDDPDLSWLGDWTDKEDDYVIDRKEGVFLGEYINFEFNLDVPEIDAKEGMTSPEWATVETRVEAKIKADYNVVFDWDYLTLEHLEDTAHTFYVYGGGRKILAEDLGRHVWDNRHYRYFKPGENHVPHNPDNWQHLSQESLAEVIKEHGSIEQADYDYALEDWKRMESYVDQYWSMTGCEATIFANGIELESASVWGVESDCGENYEREIERDQIYEALEYSLKKTENLHLALQALMGVDLEEIDFDELEEMR